ALALLLRAERRHELRGGLLALRVFLPPVRAGRRRLAGAGPGWAGCGRRAGDEADGTRLRAHPRGAGRPRGGGSPRRVAGPARPYPAGGARPPPGSVLAHRGGGRVGLGTAARPDAVVVVGLARCGAGGAECRVVLALDPLSDSAAVPASGAGRGRGAAGAAVR